MTSIEAILPRMRAVTLEMARAVPELVLWGGGTPDVGTVEF